MNLAQYSIERNRISFLLLAIVMVLGLAMYGSLARDSMPPFTVRVATVVTSFPGASPERVEQLVTDRLEKVAQELPELKELTSTSRTGLSVIKVSLKDEVKPGELQAVWDRLRRKLADVRGLPDGVTPDLQDDGIGEVFGIAIALTSDGFTYVEMKRYADDLRDALIKLDEAAKVELGGVQEERVFIEFDDTRLAEYNLSAGRLQSVISATNILGSGGQVNLEDERIVLEPTGNYNSVEDIERTLVPIGSTGQMVFLGDIATVRKMLIDPPTQIVRKNGRDAITIHISLKYGANITVLGEAVDGILRDWEAVLPVGLEASRIASMDVYIDEKVSAFVANLVQAIAIVLVVMLFFLGFRTGLVVSSHIPIVTIATLMLMGLFDIGLNQVTLAALIMALGMMVDNAIVIAEAIMVKMEEGAPAKKAAIDSSKEMFVPLLISTLTTSAAFLAFYLAESAMGDIVGPIFVVITMALLSSWLVALSIIATLCFLFIRLQPKGEQKPRLIDRMLDSWSVYYRDLILAALARKTLVLAGTVLIFALSVFGFRFIPFVFFPDSDRNVITIDVNLPLGTRIERTMAVVEGIEGFMRDSLQVGSSGDSGITDWASFIGKGPESYDMGYSAAEANSSYAHVLVNTSSFQANNDMIARLDAFGYRTYPDADILVGSLAAGGGGIPIEIKVSGQDPDQLARISERVRMRMVDISGTKNVKDDWGPQSKKFVVRVDQARAQSAGVSSQDIATSLRTVLDGFRTGEYREEDRSIPIIMRSEQGQQQTLESLETLNIYAQSTGKSVPFLQVADLDVEWQYSRIKRLDLRRTTTISSDLTADANASDIMETLLPWLNDEATQWPSGYTFTTGGDDENTAENMGAVMAYLPLAGAIIVLLLVLQFNSFRKTAMVLLTVPLGVIGVTTGLLVFREPFSFMAFLGLISLSGIVINNAIVLLDRIEIEEQQMKRSTQDAIMMACLTRFRPILLATFTTVLGLVPLYLSGGEMWEGMSVSIMIGLLFGTMITLVLIPSLYSVLFRVDFSAYRFDEALLSRQPGKG